MAESVFSEQLRQLGQLSVAQYKNKKSKSAFKPLLDFIDEDIGPREQYELDRKNLSSVDFSQKYGAKAQEDRVFASPKENLDPLRVSNEENYKRTLGEQANDYARQVGAGIFQGTTSLANLGLRIAEASPTAKLTNDVLDNLGINAGPTTDETTRAIAKFGNSGSEFLREGESAPIKRQTELASDLKQAKLQDSIETFDKSDKKLVDHLKQIGREAIIEGENLATNSSYATSVTAQAVGSMIPSLFATGGTTAVAKNLLSKTALGEGSKKLATRAVTAATIGGVEGQGAYDQTIVQVLDMSEDELSNGSPEYRKLREEGASHEEAQGAVAEKAATKAQLIQTGLASVAGYTVAKFEANPLTRQIARNNIKVLLSQTGEEAFQSGTGQTSSNIGIKEFADTDRNISEGVGEATTQGAFGGFGATAVITTPGVVRDVAIKATEDAGKAVRHGISVAAAETRRRYDDASPVGEKATSERIDDIDSIVTRASDLATKQADLSAAAENGTLAPEALAEFETAVNELGAVPVSLADTTSEDFVAQTESFKEDVVDGSRLKTLRNVVRGLKAEKYKDPATAAAAAEFAINQVNELQEIVEQVEAKDPETVTKTEQAVGEIVSAVLTNPAFVTGTEKATEALNNTTGPKSAVSPREMVLNPVTIDPTRLTPEVVEEMPPEVQKAAEVIRSINPPTSGQDETSNNSTPDPKNRLDVRKELVFTDKESPYKKVMPSFNSLVSMAIRGAIKHTRHGNTEVTNEKNQKVDSKDVFARLGNLVQNQLNKYEAGLESMKFVQNNPGKDGAIRYPTLDVRTGTTFSAKENGRSFFVNPNNENSMETFRQVIEDTNTGIRAYNALLEQYPDVYEGKPYELLPEIPRPTKTESTQETSNEDTNDTVDNVSSDTAVESGVRTLGSDELSFETLFEGGIETSFKKAIAYLNSFTNLDNYQKGILSIVSNSAFVKSNPDAKVRRIRPDEEKPNENANGWWNPNTREIVLSEPRISETLHEFIHAATLQVLHENLAAAIGKTTALTPEEQAAYELMQMSNEFIDSKPTSTRMAQLQALMRQAITEAENPADGQSYAINEFMAYGLTEKGVSSYLNSVQYEKPSLAKSIKNFVKRLFGVPVENETVFARLVMNTHTLARDYQTALQTERQTRKAETRKEDAPTPAAPTNDTAPEQEAEVQKQPEPAPAKEAEPEAVEEKVEEPLVETKKKSSSQTTQETDPETIKTMEEELLHYEDSLDDAKKQLSDLHKPIKDIITLDELLLIGRESTAPRAIANRISKTAEYKTAVDKIDAYEVANPEGMEALDHALETAPEIVKDMRGARAQIKRMEDLIAYEKDPSSVPAVKDSTPPSVEAAPAPTPEPQVAADAAPEATAVPAATASPTVVAEVSQTTVEQSSIGENLITDLNGKSPVLEAYKFNPVLKPGDDLLAAVEAAELSYDIDKTTKETVSKLDNLADNILGALNKKLNATVKEPYSKAKGSYAKILTNAAKNEGDIDILYQSRKVFNLLDQTALENGEFQYDPYLMKLAVLAALDYVMNDSKGASIDLEDALKSLGISENTQLTADLLGIIYFGLPQSSVKTDLARHIKDFWGVETNKDISETMVEGIVQSVAEEIIEVMANQGNQNKEALPEEYWMQSKSKTVRIDNNPKTFYSVRTGDKRDLLGPAKTVLQDTLAPEKVSNRSYSVGKSIENVDDTLLKDRGILVPEKKRLAAKNQQDTPYRPSPDGVAIAEWLLGSQDSGKVSPLARILGWTDFKDTFYNRFDRVSREGKNSSIKSSINGVFDQIAKLKAYAEFNEENDWMNVPTFYQIGFTLNGRFQMQGFNPQGNKLARELFVPSVSNLDLTNSDHLEVFYAAVNQAFDQKSTKIENIGIPAAAENAKKFLEGEYKEGLDAIRNKDAEAFVEFMSRGDVESTARMVKALYAAVRLQDALERGDKEFKVDLAIELDGKTNGPINSAIQNNTDEWTVEDLLTYRRGGFYVGQTKDSNNNPLHYSAWVKTANDSADFYKAVANGIGAQLVQLRDSVKAGIKTYGGMGRPENIKNVLEVQRMVIGLFSELGEIKFEPSEPDSSGKPTGFDMIIERKNTKGPITQKIYGSGLKAIAAQMSNAMIQMVYEDVGEAVRTGDAEALLRRTKMLENIFGIHVGKTKGRNSLLWTKRERARKNGLTLSETIQDRSNNNAWFNRLENFQFDSNEFERLSNAILHTYLPGFAVSYDNNVGASVAYLNNIMVSASQTVAEVRSRITAALLDAETKTQRESGKLLKTHELSANDRNRIINSTLKYGLVVSTGASTYGVGADGFETSDQVEARIIEQAKSSVSQEAAFYPFNTSLEGATTQNKRRFLDDPRVKILPYNVVANADVDLITDVNTDDRISHDILSVHDGVEINNLLNLTNISKVMNEAVYKTWTKNTIQPVVDALDAFIESEKDARRSGVDLNIEERDGSLTDAYDKVTQLRRMLQLLADRREAKIKAIESVQNTADGTPGAQAPFYSDGEAFTGSEDALINHLNRVTNEALAEIHEKRQAESKKPVAQRVESEPERGSKLRKALNKPIFKGPEEINEFLDVLNDTIENADQRFTLSNLVSSFGFKDLVDAGLSIVIEDPGNAPYFNAATNTIHLSKVTNEAAVHELVHSATIHQLVAHYEDPASNPKRAEAVSRLEHLANSFLASTFKKDSLEADLQHNMRELITTGKETEALNEFMAWSLSNEELIERGKKRIATDALSNVVAFGRKAIRLMRNLLGFSSDKVFHHVLFNTKIIMNTRSDGSRSEAILRQQTFEQVADQLSDDSVRKLRLQEKIGAQITSFLNKRNNGDDRLTADTKQAQALAAKAQAELNSLDALTRVNAAGFDISNPQDVLLFRSLQSMFSMDLNLDRLSRLEAQKIYEKISDRLSTASFLRVMDTTGPQATQYQDQMANRMYRVVLGLPFTTSEDTDTEFKPNLDDKGLSDRLATFLALAQTSSVMREVLADIDFKSLGLKTELDNQTLDDVINTATQKTIRAVNRRVIEDPASQQTSSHVALDVLTEQLLSYEEDAATGIELDTSSFLNRVNRTAKAKIEAAGEATSAKLKEGADVLAQGNSLGKLTAAVLEISAGFADLLVADKAEAKADKINAWVNNDGVPNAIRELVSEVRGITDDNRLVFRLVKAAKQQISALRQVYVEGVPKVLGSSFSDEFFNGTDKTKHKENAQRVAADFAHMYVGFGKTDISAVIDTLGESTALNLFGDADAKKSARESAIKEIQKALLAEAKALDLSEAQTKRIVEAWYKKAAQLSEYQVNYKTGSNLLQSAEAILGLNNEDGLSLSKGDHVALRKALAARKDLLGNPKPNTGLNKIIHSIDTLASLEAMNRLPQETQARLRHLVTNETEAVKDALSYMRDLRSLERKKSPKADARMNGSKGYMFSNTRRKYSIIVANDSEAAVLAEQGYVRLRDYQDPEARYNPAARNRGYYFSAHKRLANYNQGALQTVQDTYFGIDPRTGLRVGPETTGEVIQGDPMIYLNRLMKRDSTTQYEDNLIPFFNSDGDLIGFERALAPDMISQLEFSNNFLESLGKWSGRIQEEKAAEGANQALVDALKATYDEAVVEGTTEQFAEFGWTRDANNQFVVTKELENDPIWKESYFLIPKATRDYAERIFGGPIKIRRDMVNNALGFRSASVSDIYTGKVRMDEELREMIKDIFLATPFLGKDMYKYLTTAEEAIQTVVSEVKHVIVIKSGVILAANTMSNIIQLAGREVPLAYMAKHTRTKYAEVARYKDNEQLKIDLRVQMLAATSKSHADAIKNRIETIEESERRMSIWPLIEANQFTTISEGLTDTDKALMDGKFVDWIERKAGELPGSLSTAARYAIVAKDTALYKGMARAVQYSDFIAKSVYYDFLTKERGLSPEQAIDKIDAEFINYDLNDGRTRTYLESMGLTWFMNFKIRALKIALDMARNNPASVLFSLTGASLLALDAGSPVTDNLAGAAADGRLGYSIGPGMIEAGWNLNIWKQLFG